MKLLLLLVTYVAATTVLGQSSEDLSNLDQQILEDIYYIYNLLPLRPRVVPDIAVTPNNVGFYLFTNNNTNDYTLIGPNNASVVSKDAPILFLIHGWIEDRTTERYQLFTETFFGLDYNIIQVDYSKYAYLDYVTATSCVPDIGQIIGEFIVTLVQNYSVPIDNILVIGHSLGGQVSSYVGRTVQNLTDTKLPRIIAADPAGVLFEGRPEDQRLNPNDATVVEVVHSNGGVFGYLYACGTIDFFLNGGTSQPGCLQEMLANLTEINSTVFCADYRSWEVLASAIQNRNQFKARKCNNYLTYSLDQNLCPSDFVYLGNIATTETGDYYLDTTSSPPYYEES